MLFTAIGSVAGLVAVAAYHLLTDRGLPRRLLYAGAIAWASIMLALVAYPVAADGLVGLQPVPALCAALCFFWALSAAALERSPEASRSAEAPVRLLAGMAWITAAVTGTTAAALEGSLLLFRLRNVLADLFLGWPMNARPDLGFGPGGLAVWMTLLAAALVTQRSRREPLFGAISYAIALAAAWHAALLLPAFRFEPGGQVQRTGVGLVLLVGCAVVQFVGARVWCCARFRGGAASDEPACSSVVDAEVSSADTVPIDHDVRYSALVFTFMPILILVAYNLVAPVREGGFGYRLGSLATAACAAMSAWSGLCLLRATGKSEVADAFLGLASLTLCALVSIFVPNEPWRLTDRFPLVFGALVVGLGGSAWAWAWLSSIDAARWLRLRVADRAGWLRARVERFAFLTAALGVMVAVVRAAWPRLPFVAVGDDSLGAIISGVGGGMLLVVATAWHARQTVRVTTRLLSFFASVSTLAFVVVRIWPFLSFG
jgi:hypothetical protein